MNRKMIGEAIYIRFITREAANTNVIVFDLIEA
jgi:hypothetical protein